MKKDEKEVNNGNSAYFNVLHSRDDIVLVCARLVNTAQVTTT